VQAICRFAGIDDDFYGMYSFDVVNRAVAVRHGRPYHWYRRQRDRTATRLKGRPALSKAFDWVTAKGDTALYKVFTRPPVEAPPSMEIANALRAIYVKDNERLAAIVGEAPPWAR
jgi:hypothetical protein